MPTCQRSSRGNSTATGSTARTSRSRATALTRTTVLDPYAKSIGRDVQWADELFAYRMGDPEADLSFDDRDNAAYAPLAVVIDPAFTWGDDRPRAPLAQTVIYELHVKGFTQHHPEVPERLRGTYAGLASELVVKHLASLGVTAVELEPVHHFLDDRGLVERGLTNYWGYNTLAYFAPASRYAAAHLPQDAVQQFKMMVAALHAAGIEVILDVVYNHTAEGNQMGPPCLCAALTTARTTSCRPTTPATTWTTPAVATRSMSGTPVCCSSSWTASATG